jgi:hypothetical protein
VGAVIAKVGAVIAKVGAVSGAGVRLDAVERLRLWQINSSLLMLTAGAYALL